MNLNIFKINKLFYSLVNYVIKFCNYPNTVKDYLGYVIFLCLISYLT